MPLKVVLLAFATAMASHFALSSAVLAVENIGSDNPANWPGHGGGPDENSFSRLKDIDVGNVANLGLAWSLDLPGEQSLEATPLAINGKLFFTGSNSTVYAVDAITGQILWKYDPEIYKHMPQHMRLIFPVNRGVAYWKGKVFVGTIDGRLVALDAKTGKPVWSVVTVSADSKNTITGAPRVFNDKVVIGNGGADWAARGYVTAYDTETGKQRWRFYTVPTNPAKEPSDAAMALAAKTWGGDWWKVGGGGGTVWDSMTYDPEFNRLYIGVGNSGPYDPRVRSPGNGDNLFLASIVALDADSGKYVWHYQINPREAWDYKASATMVAALLTIDGKPRKVLMQSPTNGFFYVLDRTTGKLISAEKTGKVTWADRIDIKTGRPVETYNIRYDHGPVDMWPSPFGTHNWQSMSFNPQNGLVYIPYIQLGARYSAQAQTADPAHPVASLGGVSITPLLADDKDGTGSLLAWDPVKQKARWRVDYPSFWNGGTLSTAGGLVFQGNADGDFAGFDANSGARLWHFDAKLGIIASPIAFQANGMEYVSILVGYGGATPLWSSITNRGWKFNLQPRRLLTFALNSHAVLPPTAPPDFQVHAVDNPTVQIDDTRVAAGATVYGNCVMCHGLDLLSAGAPAPDLRESAAALTMDGLTAVVRGGALMASGMPRFEALTDNDLLNVYMYIRAGARTSLGTRKAPMDSDKPNHF